MNINESRRCSTCGTITGNGRCERCGELTVPRPNPDDQNDPDDPDELRVPPVGDWMNQFMFPGETAENWE